MDSFCGIDLSTFRKHKKFWISLVVLKVLIIIILLIVGFTVLKPKDAVTTVNSVKLKGLQYAVDIPRMSVELNVSLNIDLTVKNPNRVSFKYGNSTALLYYRGILVAEAAILAGQISSRETKEMTVTLVIMADRLVSNLDLFSDVRAGTVPLNATTSISGSVALLMKSFKHHVVSNAHCDLPMDVRKRTVGFDCRYKTKL